jgi:hypothetical protein
VWWWCQSRRLLLDSKTKAKERKAILLPSLYVFMLLSLHTEVLLSPPHTLKYTHSHRLEGSTGDLLHDDNEELTGVRKKDM